MIHKRAFTKGQVSFHSANVNFTANLRVERGSHVDHESNGFCDLILSFN